MGIFGTITGFASFFGFVFVMQIIVNDFLPYGGFIFAVFLMVVTAVFAIVWAHSAKEAREDKAYDDFIDFLRNSENET